MKQAWKADSFARTCRAYYGLCISCEETLAHTAYPIYLTAGMTGGSGVQTWDHQLGASYFAKKSLSGAGSLSRQRDSSSAYLGPWTSHDSNYGTAASWELPEVRAKAMITGSSSGSCEQVICTYSQRRP